METAHSPHNRRVHVLRNQRRIGAHPQLAAADRREAPQLDVEVAVRIAASAHAGQRKLDRLASPHDVGVRAAAVGERLGADAHQRERAFGEAEVVGAEQALRLGDALALDLHLPDVRCFGGGGNAFLSVLKAVQMPLDSIYAGTRTGDSRRCGVDLDRATRALGGTIVVVVVVDVVVVALFRDHEN